MNTTHFGGEERQPTSVAATPSHDVNPPRRNDDVTATSRHRFTITVEDVAAQLQNYGLDRDQRTIQRWCESGKLSSIKDAENGDRYLIDPATLTPLIDDMLEKLSSQRDQRRVSDATVEFTPRYVRDNLSRSIEEKDIDTGKSGATMSHEDDDVAAASRQSRVSDATTTEREKELERKVVMLEAEKAGVERLVEYLQTNFDKRLAEDRHRDEYLGRIEGENRMLRAMLPPGTVNNQNPLPFTEAEGVDSRDQGSTSSV